jgi:hypothetical protein
MDFKPGIYHYASGALILIALVLGIGFIFGGVGSYPTPRTDITYPLGERATRVVDLPAVTGAIVAASADDRPYNPFDLSVQTARRAVADFPLPPPPPLGLPEPIPLPLEGGAR